MFKNFMKKYGYYLMAFVLILAVGLTVGLTGEDNTKIYPNEQVENSEDADPTSTVPISMLSPLKSPQVLKWYSDSELFYNATLNQWESHKAVDLTSDSGDVYAVLDGVIIDCSYNYADGYCVKIRHDDGIVTSYCSLSNLDSVTKGKTVKRGDKIGEISNSGANELGDGGHLHFAVELNGKPVDPSNYISFENK